MHPYKIDQSKLRESEKNLDQKDLIKLELISALLKAISKMESNEALEITGLDKSNLSRLKSLSLKRFSIERIINLLDHLGLATKVDVKPKKTG